jgi:hypothetical protein
MYGVVNIDVDVDVDVDVEFYTCSLLKWGPDRFRFFLADHRVASALPIPLWMRDWAFLIGLFIEMLGNLGFEQEKRSSLYLSCRLVQEWTCVRRMS